MKLQGSERLLIGARARLERNDTCLTTPGDLEHVLRNRNTLHDLGTSESSLYVDSMTSTIGFSVWGVNLTGSRVYKRRNGQTLKSALLDQWTHGRDGSRMIKDLEKAKG